MHRNGKNRGAVAAWVMALATLVVVPSALAAPARLHLSIEKTTLKVGERARLRIDFLDRDYRPVANDRERTVYLETRSAGPAETGSGDVAPSQVTAAPGGAAGGVFRAARCGRLLIRATSDGLAPAQELVTVVAEAGSGLMQILLPPVHAWAEDAFAIYPRSHLPVPVNGSSTALFQVTVGRRLERGEVVRVRIRTQPEVPVSYGGRQNLGFAEFEIPEGASQSTQIEVSSAQPRLVSVSARVIEARPGDLLPSTMPEAAAVQFVAPRPEWVVLEPERTSVPPLLLPFTVRLADQEKTKISVLDQSHTIELSSPSRVSFDRKRLQLSPERPSAHATARFGFLSWGEQQIVATDLEKDLGSGSATVSVRIAALALMLCAALSGAFGSLARHVYRIRTSRLLPAWGKGGLNPGLLGNTVFGAGFGEVLYQAARVGVLDPALVLAGRAPEDGTLMGLALLLGVLGGFGGVVILDRLTERILPAPKTA